MKKLFYTLVLSFFALNLCAEGKYTAYIAFDKETSVASVQSDVTIENAKTEAYPYIYIVKHNGQGSVIYAGTYNGTINLTTTNNATYINNSRPNTPEMSNFYIYTNEEFSISEHIYGAEIKNIVDGKIQTVAKYYIEDFTPIQNNGNDFAYAYQSCFNQTIFGTASIDDGYGSVPVNNETKYFYDSNVGFNEIADITYSNNSVPSSLKNLKYTGSITNTITNVNINYYQFISTPYLANVIVRIGSKTAIYTYNGNSADDATEPAFVIFKYDSQKSALGQNPWVDNGSTTLQPGIGYILGIDNRGFSGSASISIKSTQNINSTKTEGFTINNLANTTGGEKADDDNVHLIGSGLFFTPTGCLLDSRFVYFALPTVNSYEYVSYYSEDINRNTLQALAPHKSFFVQMAGDITFNYSGNISKNAPSLKRAIEQQVVVEEYALTLTGTDFEERTTILTDELGTEGYTIGEDFMYFHSTPNGEATNKFYTFDAERTLSFNHRANTTQTIQLGGLVAQDGRYTISLEGINTKATSVILTDIAENTFVDLLNENYTFDANSGSLDGRFTITINYAPGTTVDTDIVAKSNGIIVVNNTNDCSIENLIEGEQVMIFDAMGRLVYNAQADATAINVSLTAGTYIVRQANNFAKFVIK